MGRERRNDNSSSHRHCVSAAARLLCVRFSLCLSNIQVVMSLCLLNQSGRPYHGQVFTVEMIFLGLFYGIVVFCVNRNQQEK